MDAVLVCIDRVGMRNFALEDVAAEAGMSRATIYRHFDGGRDQLIRETVAREVGRFWGELAVEVAHIPTLEGRLVAGLMAANRKIADHHLLQKLLGSEPEELLPSLFESESLVDALLRDYLRALLEGERLREGIEPAEAADYLARMLVMHMASHGRWNLQDEAEVRRLVRTQFLAGILPPEASTAGDRVGDGGHTAV
jgi:AcrR family transcriptional regulator